MNLNKLYSGNTGVNIKLTEEDLKQMQKDVLKGIGLLNIGVFVRKEKGEENTFYTLFMDERFIRNNFICNFIGEDVLQYEENFNKQMETCMFLNTACNYQSMKKYLFYFDTEIEISDNDEFNKKYEIEIKFTVLSSEVPNKWRSITYFQGGHLYFNIYYDNLLMSMELFTLWLLELKIEIILKPRKK